jgi:hypothetical protein
MVMNDIFSLSQGTMNTAETPGVRFCGIKKARQYPKK